VGQRAIVAIHIPIEQPSRFEYVINLRTAKEMSLEIPANFVLRAVRLIE
jgi:hypothetical protein